MLLVRLAWRNLWRAWRRSAVVLTAIAVGLAASLALVAWTRGVMVQMADNQIDSHLADIAVHALGYQADPDVANGLSDGGAGVLAVLDARAGVHAAPRVVGDGLVQSARSSIRAAIVGVDPSREPDVTIVAESVVEGEYLSTRIRPKYARGLPPILIGRAMAERLRLGLRDKLVLHVPGETGLGAFRVRGLFVSPSAEFDKGFAFIQLSDAQRLFDVGGGVTEVAIALDRPSRAGELQEELRRGLEEIYADAPVEVLRWQERQPQFAALLDLMSETAWILYAAVFVAMVFGIANVVLMSVFERTREFGVLRSLGLGAGRLVALILTESLLLTALGVVIGVGLGIPLVLWLGAVGIDLGVFAETLRAYGVGAVMYPRLASEDLSSPILLAAVTALLAGIWPAVKVARLRPAQALRHH
jgi:ABC-type lipoprotein release transport system permease subunit